MLGSGVLVDHATLGEDEEIADVPKPPTQQKGASPLVSPLRTPHRIAPMLADAG